jgi:hypothetical protein
MFGLQDFLGQKMFWVKMGNYHMYLMQDLHKGYGYGKTLYSQVWLSL